jgi:uncharacterized protein YjbI with pentapeptide repeats
MSPKQDKASPSKDEILLPRLPRPLPPVSPALIEPGAEVDLGLLGETDLTGLEASNLLLEQLYCRRTTLAQSHLEGLRLFDVRLEGCDLAGAAWPKARLRRVEFIGCRLLGTDLAENNFEDVIFRDCQAERASFATAVFKAARFEACNLKGAFFEGADLTGVIFHACDLSQADLRGARLQGADFRNANLNGMKAGVKELQGAIIAPFQAVQVVNLLGVVVKEVDEPEV